MGKYLNNLDWIIGFGLWPTYFVIVLLVSTILNKIIGNKNIQLLDEENNYSYHDKNLFPSEKNSYISILMLIIFIFMFPFICLSNDKFMSYIDGMMNKIEVISSMCIGLTSFVITLAVFAVVFDKKYYIVFSIKEVLSKYKFSYFLILEIVSCLIICLATCTLLDCKLITLFDYIRFIILEYAFFIFIICTFYLLFILIMIIFSDKKNELKLLKELYTRFWQKDIDISNMKENWRKQDTEINVEHLVDRYLIFSKNKKIKEITQIEYVYINGEYKNIYIKYAKLINIKLIFVLFIISVFVCLVAGGKYYFILVNFMFTILMIGMCSEICHFLDDTIFKLYCATSGYDIIKDKDKHNYLIVAVPLRKSNKYDKYFNSMNSLVAFFYIGLFDIKDENNHDELKNQFIDLIKYFKKREYNNFVEYFPLFSIGNLFFYNGNSIDEIKEVYKELMNLNLSKFSFQKMLYSQSVYIASNSRLEMEANKEKTIEYLMWLDE